MKNTTLFLGLIVCLLLTFAAVLLASDPASRSTSDDLWPTKDWASASPASVGMDEQVLHELTPSAFLAAVKTKTCTADIR
jgi:hypothetical protein